MNEVKNWMIAVVIGVPLAIIVAIACILLLLNSLYTNEYNKQNKEAQQYISSTQEVQTESAVISTEQDDTIYVEEDTTEEITEEEVYWDPGDDTEQVYFTDSSKITGQGFLPYDILGPLNVFIQEKLRALGDMSREMIIDDSTQNEKVSVIYFHTAKGKYTYRYDWENKTQELLED